MLKCNQDVTDSGNFSNGRRASIADVSSIIPKYSRHFVGPTIL